MRANCFAMTHIHGGRAGQSPARRYWNNSILGKELVILCDPPPEMYALWPTTTARRGLHALPAI